MPQVAALSPSQMEDAAVSVSRLLDDVILIIFVLSSFLSVAFAIYERTAM